MRIPQRRGRLARSSEPALARRTPTGPSDRRNRFERVPDQPCGTCGAPVMRAARGPAPSRCPACAVQHRQPQQLRAYLRSAVRLAEALGLDLTAGAIRAAIEAADGEVRR